MITILLVCVDLLALEPGKKIHGYPIKNGFEYDVVVGTTLIGKYGKCENVNIAHKLLKRMPKQNVVSWNAIIFCYFRSGYPHETLAFFNEMKIQGLNPNSIP